MLVQEMHWEFKKRYNKIDSNHKKDLTPAEIDSILNDAIFQYVEIFSTGNNAKRYNLGFEVTQQRIDMLSTLVIGQPKQPLLLHTNFDEECQIYEYDFNDLLEPYFHLIRSYAKTSCGKIRIKEEQHDDLDYILNDFHRKPSKKWKRLVSAIKSSSNPETESSLYVYTNGEFVLEGIYLEYIKCPKKVFLGGYNTLEYETNQTGLNATDDPVHSDLPNKYHTIIIDIAVEEVSRILEDSQRMQLKQEKISKF